MTFLGLRVTLNHIQCTDETTAVHLQRAAAFRVIQEMKYSAACRPERVLDVQQRSECALDLFICGQGGGEFRDKIRVGY